MDPSRRAVLHIYRNLLKEGRKFQDYNFREYTLRRIRDSFKENKLETYKNKIQEFIRCAEDNLELIKRQTIIGNLYESQRLVLERK